MKKSDVFDEHMEQERLEQILPRYSTSAFSITDHESELYTAERAMEHVRGPAVLVLGAATGAWIGPLLAKVDQLDIVDAVVETVDRLTSTHPGVICGHVALFERFEPSRRYDTVILGHVLEHVFDPRLVLSRVRGWLCPGGRVIVAVPNARSLHRWLGVELGLLESLTAFSPADRAVGHRRVYTREALTVDMEAAGLRVTMMSGLVLKPLSNAQMDTWSPEMRCAWRTLGDLLPEYACVLLCLAESA